MQFTQSPLKPAAHTHPRHEAHLPKTKQRCTRQWPLRLPGLQLIPAAVSQIAAAGGGGLNARRLYRRVWWGLLQR